MKRRGLALSLAAIMILGSLAGFSSSESKKGDIGDN